MRLAGIADLSKDRALAALKRTSFPEEKYDISATMSLKDGLKSGKTVITTDSAALIATPGIDVIQEVTGNPAAGVKCPPGRSHSSIGWIKANVSIVLRTQETHRDDQCRG
jgi:predicted homoserine dehydrogenase-like protein